MTANPGDAPDLRGDPPPQRRRPIPADTLSTRMAIARMHAGHLTIREAAERCGLNYASWSNWEQGSKPRNLLDVVHAISEGLDIDRDWLLFGGPLAPSARPHNVRNRPGEATVRYPLGPVRPIDNRPTGRALGGVGATREVGSLLAPPSGPASRRPRRIK